MSKIALRKRTVKGRKEGREEGRTEGGKKEGGRKKEGKQASKQASMGGREEGRKKELENIIFWFERRKHSSFRCQSLIMQVI